MSMSCFGIIESAASLNMMMNQLNISLQSYPFVLMVQDLSQNCVLFWNHCLKGYKAWLSSDKSMENWEFIREFICLHEGNSMVYFSRQLETN